MSEPEDFVMCRICGKKFQQIHGNHLREHSTIPKEYKDKFPEAPMISGRTRKMKSAAMIGENNPMKRPEIRALFVGENHPMYGKKHTEESKAKISASLIGKYTGEENPFYGKKHTEETKAKMSAAKKGKYTGEENHFYGKTFTHTEETKVKISASSIESWKDPEFIDKHTGENASCFGRTGKKHPSWKGGTSFLPYCHLFNNNLKEQIRNRWGRVCILTDLMRSTLGLDAGLDDFEGHEIFSKQRLSVHHIYGNKMAGCDGTELALIPLQAPFNSKKFDDLKLEDHPFYITLFMFKDLERKDREQRINGG